MTSLQWGIVGIAAVISVWLGNRGGKKATNTGVVGVPVRRVRIPVVATLVGLVKTGVIFLVFAGASALYLRNPHPVIAEWAMLIVWFADIAMLALAYRMAMPKVYREYIDTKPKNKSAPLDYVVGACLSVILIAGCAMQITALSNGPGLRLP